MKWIKCSDRLPEVENATMLVIIWTPIDERWFVGYICRHFELPTENDGKFSNHDLKWNYRSHTGGWRYCDMQYISHWREIECPEDE